MNVIENYFQSSELSYRKFSVIVNQHPKIEDQLWVILKPGKHLMECPVYRYGTEPNRPPGFYLAARDLYEFIQIIESRGFVFILKKDENQKPDRINNIKEAEELISDLLSQYKEYIRETFQGDECLVHTVLPELNATFDNLRNGVDFSRDCTISGITRLCQLSFRWAIKNASAKLEGKLRGLAKSFAEEFDCD